jgi:hypothetical protein
MAPWSRPAAASALHKKYEIAGEFCFRNRRPDIARRQNSVLGEFAGAWVVNGTGEWRTLCPAVVRIVSRSREREQKQETRYAQRYHRDTLVWRVYKVVEMAFMFQSFGLGQSRREARSRALESQARHRAQSQCGRVIPPRNTRPSSELSMARLFCCADSTLPWTVIEPEPDQPPC